MVLKSKKVSLLTEEEDKFPARVASTGIFYANQFSLRVHCCSMFLKGC